MQRNAIPTERQVDLRGNQLITKLKRCKDLDLQNQTVPADLLEDITPKYEALRQLLREETFPSYFSGDLVGDSRQFAIEAKLEKEYAAERLANLHVLFFKLTPAELLNHLRGSMNRLIDTYQTDDAQLQMIMDMIRDDGYPNGAWFDTWIEWLRTSKFELPCAADALIYISYQKSIMTTLSPSAGGAQDVLRMSVNAQIKDPSILIGSLMPKKQCVAVKDASDGGYMMQQLEQVYFLMCSRAYGEHRDELVKTVTPKEQSADFFQDVIFADGFDVMQFLSTTMVDRPYTVQSVDLMRTYGSNNTLVPERAIGVIEPGKTVPTLALVACKDPCKNASSPDVWYACNVSFLIQHDEEEDEEGGGKKLSKHTVNTAIKSGDVSHWSLQALVFHRLMNKASATETPDLHTYVNMSSEERKQHTSTILEVFTESYNAYQYGKQAKELKKLFGYQDKVIKMAAKDPNFITTKEGEAANAKYDRQELSVKSMMQHEFPLMPFTWNGSSTLAKASEQSKAAVVLSLKQSAVCDDMAKAEWILNHTIDMFMSAFRRTSASRNCRTRSPSSSATQRRRLCAWRKSRPI